MKVFKPIQNLVTQASQLMQIAHDYVGKAGGKSLSKGLKGVVQNLFDLDIESAMDEADAHLGKGVMRLAIAGDTEGVETVVRFRNYAVIRFEELKDMRDIVNTLISEDSSETRRAVGEMGDFLDSRDQAVSVSGREEALKLEIERLRGMVRKMSMFLETEEEFLEGEGLEEAETPAESPAPARSDAGIVVGSKTGANSPAARRSTPRQVSREGTRAGRPDRAPRGSDGNTRNPA